MSFNITPGSNSENQAYSIGKDVSKAPLAINKDKIDKVFDFHPSHLTQYVKSFFVVFVSSLKNFERVQWKDVKENAMIKLGFNIVDQCSDEGLKNFLSDCNKDFNLNDRGYVDTGSNETLIGPTLSELSRIGELNNNGVDALIQEIQSESQENIVSQVDLTRLTIPNREKAIELGKVLAKHVTKVNITADHRGSDENLEKAQQETLKWICEGMIESEEGMVDHLHLEGYKGTLGFITSLYDQSHAKGSGDLIVSSLGGFEIGGIHTDTIKTGVRAFYIYNLSEQLQKAEVDISDVKFEKSFTAFTQLKKLADENNLKLEQGAQLLMTEAGSSSKNRFGLFS